MRLLGIPEELRLEIEQSGGTLTEAAALQIIQASAQAAQEDTARMVREVQEVIGPHGAVTRVQAGGVRIARGTGLGVFADGIQKTTIDTQGNIFAGSDISLPSETTFSVFVVDQDYQGEQFEAGDLLIGDNSADSSNVFWDASEGRFNFRLGTTVQVYMDTDGSITAGGGDVVIDNLGIVIANSTTSGLAFLDDSGNRDTIHIVSDPNNDFEFVNLAETPAGTISFFLKDDSGNTRRVAHMRQHPTIADAMEIDLGSTSIPGRVGFGIDHFIDFLHLDGSGSAIVYFNERNKNIDFNIQSMTDSNFFYLDASAETLAIGDIAVFDNGTDKRLEIGVDHYFPTRDSSNPNGFWNEANEDMDFSFEGTTGDIVKMDAGLNALIVSKIANGDGLAAGTYTPTLTNTTNIDSSSVVGPLTYCRVGNIVTVSGALNIDATAAGNTVLGITVPIASNFAATTDGTGIGSSQTNNNTGNISADATNDRVSLTYQATSTANTGWRVMFQYEVK